MKRTSRHYIGTFANTPAGNAEYQRVLHSMRKVIKGGRFCKFFREGTRNYNIARSEISGKLFRYGGSCALNNGKRFDVYLLPVWKFPGVISNPTLTISD